MPASTPSKIVLSFITVITVFANFSFAQKKQLTQEQILKNKMPALIVPMPQSFSWPDDSHLVFDKRFLPDTALKTITIDLKTGKETIAPKDFSKLKISAENVYLKNGEVYFSANGLETRLTDNDQPEANPVLSPDKTRVAFTRNNDLYAVDLNTKKETRLTSGGNDSIMNGFASWVYSEEILNDYRAFWWSPDSRHIAFFKTDDSPVPVFTLTDAMGQHGVLKKQRYPKAGDKNPEIKIGIISLDDGKIVWADFNEHNDQYFGTPQWRPDGSLFVTWMNRAQNDLKIYEVNPRSGAKKELYDEKQKTWIRLDNQDRLSFMKNGEAMIILSDQTGWRHIYYYDRNGKLISTLTSGNFSVTGVKWIDQKNEQIYFTARKENSARTDLYKIGLKGKDLKRLTFGDFNHDVTMSPSGDYFITTYSNVSTPARIALLNNEGKLIKDIADSKGPEFDNYVLSKTELIRVKSEDGLFDLPAIITWPLDIDPNKRYPVLLNIYGGPGASGVMDNWFYTRLKEWYAKEGLIAISIDHRGSGHFGKAGSDYMYHNLGYWEIKDYGTVIKWLIDKGYADPKRIGIMGYSYGGYVAAYGVTYGADIFSFGIDGSGVTDWSLYDTHYTERYMGTPSNDPEGYKTSSVLTYADKMKGRLLMTHGVMDDNVHIQNSMQLNSKLLDLKKDFEFILYSGGTHADLEIAKQIHYQNLRLKFFYQYLFQKPVPEGLLR